MQKRVVQNRSDAPRFSSEAMRILVGLGLQKREGQERLLNYLAEGVEHGFSLPGRLKDGGREMDVRIAQAPTGIGKSYVILSLALAAWLSGAGRKSRRNTVVSTETRVLQNQMIQKDFPAFRSRLVQTGAVKESALRGFDLTVVKGRRNYLCRRTLENYLSASAESDLLVSLEGHDPVVYSHSALKQYCRFAALSDSDRDGVREDDPILRIASCDGGDCADCPYRQAGCAYKNALMRPAPIVMTNHAMLLQTAYNYQVAIAKAESRTPLCEEDPDFDPLSDWMTAGGSTGGLDGSKVPPVLRGDLVLFDEAHHLMGRYFQSISRDCAFRVSMDELRKLLSFPIPLAESADGRDAAYGVSQSRGKVLDLWQQFFHEGTNGEPYPRLTEEFCGEIRRNMTEFRDACLRLKAACGHNVVVAGMCRKLEAHYDETRKLFSGLIRSSLDLCRGKPDEWAYEFGPEGGFEIFRRTVSRSGVLSVKELVAGLPQVRSVGLVSGTLFRDGGVSPDQLGDRIFCMDTGFTPSAPSLFVESPYRGKPVSLWIPPLPKPGKISGRIPSSSERESWAHDAAVKMQRGVLPDSYEEGFAGFLYRYVPGYVREGLGGVLVLCTSLARMNLAADVLRGPVGRTGCSLYLQGKQSKAEIARRFLTDDSPVLLGSVSFREGFDAPGRRLTWVILDRLPFPRPGDPAFERMRGRLVEVAQKRLSSEKMGEEERSFLKEMVEEKSSVLSTNSMLSDLVQSMGRLIRSDGDYGTITLLDSRAVAVAASPWKGKLDKVLKVMGEGVSVEAPDWLPSSFYSACKTLQVRATRSRQEKERLERLDRGI